MDQFGELALIIGDFHIPMRAHDIPEKFKDLLVPNKVQNVICTGNVGSKEMVDYLKSLSDNFYMVKVIMMKMPNYPKIKSSPLVNSRSVSSMAIKSSPGEMMKLLLTMLEKLTAISWLVVTLINIKLTASEENSLLTPDLPPVLTAHSRLKPTPVSSCSKSCLPASKLSSTSTRMVNARLPRDL